MSEVIEDVTAADRAAIAAYPVEPSADPATVTRSDPDPS